MTKQDKYDYLENVYDIVLYPKHLRKIVAILFVHEDSLSDGFQWYCTVDRLTNMAQLIYDSVKNES